MFSRSSKLIGVIGQGKDCAPELLQAAEEVGYYIGQRGGTLICGGLGGVMEAACYGCKSGGGTTIGVLPGAQKADANPFVDIPILTGMGEARNLIIVRSADVLIAIGGKYGTLSEIAFALSFGKPIVGLHTWQHFQQIIQVENAEQAVQVAFKLIE